MLGQYPRNPDRVAGGVEAVLAVLCAEMASRPEVELHVLSSLESVGSCCREKRDGFTVHWFPRHRGSRATFYRRDVGGLIRSVRELRPDIVHAHGTGHYAVAAVAGDVPATVVTPHGVIFREARFATRAKERFGWWLQALWERRVLRRARHIIAISPYVERELGGRTRAAFHHVENPVSDAFFAVPAEPQGTHILWVGRLIPRKDPWTAVRAFAAVKRACPESELSIAGESDTNRSFARDTRRLAASLGLDGSVHWLGELHRAEMLEQYRTCRLVLLSSLQETAPVVIGEAMAAGRPVVTTAAGGCAHLVKNGETGFVAGVGDAAELAEGIKRLITDDELSERLSGAARLEAWQRFRPSVVVDKTLDLYLDLLTPN